MRILVHFTCIVVFFSGLISCVEPPTDTKNETPLPEELTKETFEKTIMQGLTFVEFYSPYCGHCKQLAPIWKKTFEEFHEKGDQMNITMRQVNCVESGDLCQQEKITSYPNLRLYWPTRDGKSVELAEMYPRGLSRTPQNFKNFMTNAVAEYNDGNVNLPSSSHQLGNSEMLNIAAGKLDEPVFVSFWPATNAHYKNTDERGKDSFVGCMDCFEAKKNWDKLSNQVLATVRTGHFNCRSNKKVCELLGLSDLNGEGRHNKEPKYAVFLPSSAGIVRIDYTDVEDVDHMKEFAVRLSENYRYEAVNSKNIKDVMQLKTKAGKVAFASDNKEQISFVYFFDKNTVVEEDRNVLPYLLETVTNSPFNVKLFTSFDDKFVGLLEDQAFNLLEYIHYNATEPKREFDRDMHLATTMSSRPTMLMFKDNSLISSIYQNYAPFQARDMGSVTDWMKHNSFPLVGELSAKTQDHYFDESAKSREHVVVTFVDSMDMGKTNDILNDLSLSAHEYDYLRKEFYYQDLMARRNKKAADVEKLKTNSAPSEQVRQRMREEVPHLFEESDVKFVYFDLSKSPEVVHSMGLGSRQYKAGDAVVISKDRRFFYDKNEFRGGLETKPYQMRRVLQYLLSPKLVDFKLNARLVDSPYSDSLRFLDSVHKHGFKGYVMAMVMMYLVYYIIIKAKVHQKRRFQRRRDTGLGILGNVPKSD